MNDFLSNITVIVNSDSTPSNEEKLTKKDTVSSLKTVKKQEPNQSMQPLYELVDGLQVYTLFKLTILMVSVLENITVF